MSLCESCQLISGSGIFTGFSPDRTSARSNRADRRHFLTAIVLPSVPGKISYQEVFFVSREIQPYLNDFEKNF